MSGVTFHFFGSLEVTFLLKNLEKVVQYFLKCTNPELHPTVN